MRHSKQTSGERIVKDIKRKTRKQYSAEEKIRNALGIVKKLGVGVICCHGLGEVIPPNPALTSNAILYLTGLFRAGA